MRSIKKWQSLPFWVKALSLIYLALFPLVLIGLIQRVAGSSYPLEIYGLTAQSQFSYFGIFISTIFFLKSIVGLALLTTHKLAMKLAIIDSIIGISICLFIGFIYPFFDNHSDVNIVLRLELIILIPMVIYASKNRVKWENTHTHHKYNLK